MISNERRSGSGPRSYSSGHQPHVEEKTLRSEKLQIERKTFIFSLRENPRGRFLRITEDVNGRRGAIIIPAPGLEEFQKVVAAMLPLAAQPPPEPEPEPPPASPPQE
jgi:hypothetical protein